MANDNTKYLFNGNSYGKGRLVHAVVKQFIEKEQPTIEQLKTAFPKSLQGSIGVFHTQHEYDKRKQSSNDNKERFFIKVADLLTVGGEGIVVCIEWGKGNIELFVEHALKLGFDIKVEPPVLCDEEIIKQFLHKPAFKKNYQAWSDDVLKAFCDFMRYTHQSGLDIYTNNMKTGDSIRIGRKGNTHQIAKEVFTTIEPCKNKVNYAQRYRHRDDYLIYELDNDVLTELKAVGDMAAFNQEHPITRTPYWPSDYSEPALSDVEANIWKVSLSPSTFTKEELVWLEQNQVVTVHKNTGNGSANNFRDIKIGDIVSIGHGNTVFRLVKVISDITYEGDSPFNDEWLMRKYELIKGLEKPVKYKGENKRWSPRYPGTSWQVPKKEFRMFEREILKPYYQLTLEELGLDTNQLNKPEAENQTVQAMNNTSLNQILYGPPGTGKTYHSIQAAVKAAEPEVYCELGINEELGTSQEQREVLTQLYKDLFDAGRIRFVTFHQSYGYEEFVEGLSAKTEGDQLSYFEKDGVFKSICDDAKAFRVAKVGQISDSFDERLQVFAEHLAESETGVQIETLSKKLILPLQMLLITLFGLIRAKVTQFTL
ncbi:hypothetical protein [Colwellia sp. RSH04]|uniref:hypothetical protein n=1 Tax=Colwellia sp. RSH04 TaxID=2305464 RepID=UPI001C7114D7|nr:hypothetical protein [Colwellia sp. RSH04]